MRTTAMVDSAAALAKGDHACWSYLTEDERSRVLTDFLHAGVVAHEKLIYVVEPGTERDVIAYLRNSGHSAERLVYQDQLIVGSTHDIYGPEVAFNAAAQIEIFESLATEAIKEGFSGLRLFADVGEMCHRVGCTNWALYELRADLAAARLPIVALCGYDMRRTANVSLEIVDAVHPAHIYSDQDRDAPMFHLHGRDDGFIHLAGEVDASCSNVVQLLLAAAFDDIEAPVLNVSSLDFVDVTGMRAIMRGMQRIAKQDIEVHGASPMFRKLWDASGWNQVTDHVRVT